MVTTRTGERDPVTCQFFTLMIIILINILFFSVQAIQMVQPTGSGLQ